MIDFTPSIETQVKIKNALKMHDKDGKTWNEIAEEIGYTRRYLMSLVEWYKKGKHETA